MAPRLWFATLAWAAALAWAAVSCRHGPPPPIPSDLASCVPPGAVVLAGANLDALRASPLYPSLPAPALTILKPLENASSFLAVFNGADILLAAEGRFAETPPGAARIGSNLMLSGSPTLILAAQAQHRTGTPGSKDLFAQASAAAASHTIWIATRGSISLPLTGDAANLNRLLRNSQFATIGLRIEPTTQLDFTAQCANPDAARELEETLRALLSLSAAGVARQKELAAILRAADVHRDAGIVRASIAAPPDSISQLLGLFTRSGLR